MHQIVGENKKENRRTEKKKQEVPESADFKQKSLLFHVNLMYSLLLVEELCKNTAYQKQNQKKGGTRKGMSTPKSIQSYDNVERN